MQTQTLQDGAEAFKVIIAAIGIYIYPPTTGLITYPATSIACYRVARD